MGTSNPASLAGAHPAPPPLFGANCALVLTNTHIYILSTRKFTLGESNSISGFKLELYRVLTGCRVMAWRAATRLRGPSAALSACCGRSRGRGCPRRRRAEADAPALGALRAFGAQEGPERAHVGIHAELHAQLWLLPAGNSVRASTPFRVLLNLCISFRTRVDARVLGNARIAIRAGVCVYRVFRLTGQNTNQCQHPD